MFTFKDYKVTFDDTLWHNFVNDIDSLRIYKRWKYIDETREFILELYDDSNLMELKFKHEGKFTVLNLKDLAIHNISLAKVLKRYIKLCENIELKRKRTYKEIYTDIDYHLITLHDYIQQGNRDKVIEWKLKVDKLRKELNESISK